MKIVAYIRSFLMALFFPIHTAFWSTLAVIEAWTINNRKIEDKIVDCWTTGTLKIFGVSLDIKGKENIPDSGCLFLFNHTSFFDIFALSSALPNVRYGAKIELFSIPIFGPAMRAFGILPIERTKKESVFKVYDKAQGRAESGEQFALAPEGGRNTEEQLLPFKSGPFVFAINSKIPVVPVVIKNAHAVLPKNGILPNKDKWSRVIEIEFLPPTSVEGYTFENRAKLQEIVYDQMIKHF